MDGINAAQKRKIFAVARELSIDLDLLHALVQGLVGKEHISELTKAEACRVIDDLEHRADRSRDVQLPGGGKVALVNRGQLGKIRALEAELGWSANPKRLQGFCRKYAGVDDIRWLTKAQAWRLIEGLKALAARPPEAPASNN